MARPLPTCLADVATVSSMKCCASPVGLGSADIKDKIAQHFRALLGVVNFGMKLHRPHLLLGSSR